MNRPLLTGWPAVTCLLLLLFFSPALFAGTHTWKGGSSGNVWSDPANWVEGQPPNLDPNPPVILVFPAGAQSFTTVCNQDVDIFVDKMIFRAGYTVKYSGAPFSGSFGLKPGPGDKLVIESAASPTVTFDTGTNFVMGGSQGDLIRIQTGILHMKGRFTSRSQNNAMTRVEGAGVLMLDCEDGAVGNLTVADGPSLWLACQPGSNVGPFILAAETGGNIVVRTSDQLKGSPVTLDGGILTVFAGTSDTVGDLALSNGAKVFADNTNAKLKLGDTVYAHAGSTSMLGTFELNGAHRTFYVANGADLTVSGTIFDGTSPPLESPSSTGGIIKTGAGSLLLQANGSWHGSLEVETGRVSLLGSGAAGAPGGNVSVLDGAFLNLGSVTISGETLYLAGTLSVNGASCIWSGPVVLDQSARPLVVQENASLKISGPVSGDGALMTLDAGTLELAGGSANTWAGKTLVRGGTVKLSKTSGNAIPGDLEINTDITGLDAQVILTYDNQMADTAEVMLRGAAVLDLNSNSDTIGKLISGPTGQPELRLGNSRTGSSTFTVGGDNSAAYFHGRITGAENMTLQKEGTGLLTLGSNGGINTFTGETRVLAGILDVRAPQKTGPVVVHANSYLTGTGTVGAVTLNGGNVKTGHLTSESIAGNLSGGRFLADLLGAAPQPGGYDQMHVNGTLTLSGTTFLGGLSFQPQTGARFVIIKNDGSDAVTGQFTGLPEGGGLNIGGKPFSISYKGGDGNDVELKYLGTGGPPRILTVGYNRILDRIHLEALAPPGVLCQWQWSGDMTHWITLATGTPDSAGLLELDFTLGVQAPRLYFRLRKP